ncbi:P6b [Mulberry crinivirus]|nr:P6b [Mulberry crinivirus]
MSSSDCLVLLVLNAGTGITVFYCSNNSQFSGEPVVIHSSDCDILAELLDVAPYLRQVW